MRLPPLFQSHSTTCLTCFASAVVLQHKIERLEQVERCFVHIDYMERDVDDHDVEVPLAYKTAEAAQLPPPKGASPKIRPTTGGERQMSPCGSGGASSGATSIA